MGNGVKVGQVKFDNKKLEEVKEMQNDNRDESSFEVLSVKTPKSKQDMHVDKVDGQSYSAAQISSRESEFDIRQLQSSVESKISSTHERPGANNAIDAASQSSNSMFDRKAFQQYSNKKLNAIMQNSEHSKLIKFREEILKFKEKSERKRVRKLFKQKEYSPRTYKAKNQQIDKWVQIQKQEIEQTKTNFQEEWDKTIQMIEDTQKNVNHIRTKMNLGPSLSAQKVNSNNYNSQSVQSLTSHLAASKGIESNNVRLTGLGEHQRSILIEDPPKSYRSGRQEVSGMPILPINNLAADFNDDVGQGSMGVLSSRRSVKYTDNIQMAQSLLQDMNQKLANHREKQLSNRNRQQSQEFENDDVDKALNDKLNDNVKVILPKNIKE